MSTKRIPLSSLVILGLLLASCAPAGAPAPAPTKAVIEPTAPAAKPEAKPAAPSPSPKPAADQPRYGGILTTTLGADMPSYDLHQEAGLLVMATVQTAYSSLVQNKPSDPDKIISDLAESWEVSPDGTVYTFNLYKGVKFHDGSILTSEDAKTSLDRLYDPPKGVVSTRKDNLAIKSVEVAGPDSVKVILKYAQGSFLPMIAVGKMAIYPKKVVEAKGSMKKDIVGTGPYVFKEYSPGTIFEVKKNQNYFRKGLPYLDGIRFYVLRDESTRLAAFRTGQVKLIDPTWTAGLRPNQVEIISKEMPQATLQKYQSLSTRWLILLTSQPPIDDVRVRRAISLVIDRQAAIKVLAQGQADPGTIMVPGSEWAIPEAELLKMPGFRQPKDADIAEAKRLMADAGVPNGFKTTMLARAKYTDDMAVFLKEQLARLGIELDILVQESAVFLEQTYTLKYPMVAQPRGPYMTDPDEMTRYFVSGGGQNNTGIRSQELDGLFDRQSRALTKEERLKLVRELDMKMLELNPAVVLFWERGNIAFWPEVKNYYRGGVYSNNKYEDVWLAK